VLIPRWENKFAEKERGLGHVIIKILGISSKISPKLLMLETSKVKVRTPNNFEA